MHYRSSNSLRWQLTACVLHQRHHGHCLIKLQRFDRSLIAWTRMTNKLAKAVVPALTRIVGPVAVCQRGIVDVPLVWRKGWRNATQAHRSHSSVLHRCCRRLRALDPPSRCRIERSIEVVDQVRQQRAVGHAKTVDLSAPPQRVEKQGHLTFRRTLF